MARSGQPLCRSFANKRLSDDGESFSLVFTGRKENDSWNMVRGAFTLR